MTQICSACSHSNAVERGFCAACGHMLRPVCRRCWFANDAGDRFCGGCGLPVSSVASAQAVAPVINPSATCDQLDALFAVKPAEEALPAAGITQDDLDRLFGSAS